VRSSQLLAFTLAAIATLAASAPQDKTPGSASFDELVEAAQQAQRQNDLNTAALRYQEALKMHPDIPELHANLGLVDYQLGDDADASHEFQTALRLKPSLFVPNLFLGIEYLKRNEPSTALTYLSRASQLNSRDLEVSLSLGRAYAALSKDSDAILAYSNAVTFHPENEDGWYGLGTSYLNRAEALSNLLAKRYRGSSAFRALTANYFDDQGKHAQAISEYRAIVANPDAPACTHARLGLALLRTAQLTPAEDEFNRELGAHTCGALARIGLARLKMPNASAALAILLKAAENDRQEFNANAFEFYKDLPTESLRAFDQELDRNTPGESVGAAVKTRLREVLKDDRSGDFAGSEPNRPSDPGQAYLSGLYLTAASLGDKLVASGTLGPNSLYWTVRADQRLGVSALTRAVTVAPHSLRIHLLLGDLYRRKGQYPAAQQEFQEALKLDTNNVPALLGLATTLYLNGDSAPAEQTASQALAAKPDDAELRLLMAEILLARLRYTDAYKYVDPLPNGKPELLAEIHGVRGKIFAATQHPTEAIAELKKAVDNDPQGNLTYVLARQYQLVGDKQSADLAFQRSKILRQKFNERASSKFQDREQN
jgi:tetratricopeptide (TPR) repeat protein